MKVKAAALDRRQTVTASVLLIVGFAVLKLTLHLLSNVFFGYGYFRDELYYIACSERLAWGYVDHPPLIALITLVERAALGDSLVALRFLPAVAGALMVALTGAMVGRLGGGWFAVALAALAVLIAPIYLVADDMLSTIPFDHLLWTVVGYLVLRLLQTGDARYWLAIGAAVGIGLETKDNMLFLACGIVVGVLVTPARRQLRTRWPWLGGLIAFAIVLPHLIWQVQNGWPVIEFVVYAAAKNAHQNPIEFMGNQALALNPLTLPIWLIGLIYLLRAKPMAPYRMLAWLYMVPAIILIATQSSRPDYLSPAYTILFAAGAVAVERFAARPPLGWIRPAALGIILIGGLALLPVGLPVFPPDTMLRYLQSLGLAQSNVEKGKTAPLPQYYADRFGWDEMTATIGRVYESLPPDERAKAAIFTINYGEAGAVDLLGRRYGLPRAISGHNSYYLWGPDGATGDVVITVGVPAQDLQSLFVSVQQAATFSCQYCTSEEDNLPINIARGLKDPIQVVWPTLKHYG